LHRCTFVCNLQLVEVEEAAGMVEGRAEVAVVDSVREESKEEAH